MSEKIADSKNENGSTDNKNGTAENPISEKINEFTAKQEDANFDKTTAETNAELNDDGDIQKELADFKSKYNEINDKYLRLFSDFDNFRKRTSKEKIELIKYAGEDLIGLLLPVLDDFERAIKSNEKSDDHKVIKEGIQLVFQKMKNILIQQGLKEMEIIDGGFDPELHDAITKIPSPEKSKKGKIMEVIEKGYYLNNKVLRHAKVVVGD